MAEMALPGARNRRCTGVACPTGTTVEDQRAEHDRTPDARGQGKTVLGVDVEVRFDELPELPTRPRAVLPALAVSRGRRGCPA
jgi:hypothetical protein